MRACTGVSAPAAGSTSPLRRPPGTMRAFLAARAAQHRDTRCLRGLQRRLERVVQGAVAGPSHDDALHLRATEGLDHPGARAGGGCDDLDPRPARRVDRQRVRSRAPGSSGQSRQLPQPPLLDPPERPGVARRERIEAVACTLRTSAPRCTEPAIATSTPRADGTRATATASAGSAARRPAATWPAASRRSAPPASPAPARGAGSRRSPPACRCRG